MKQVRSRHMPRIAAFCFVWLLITAPVSVLAASRFVFAVNFIAGSVSTYRVDAETGMLHHIHFTPTLEGPSSLVLRPDGKFLYVSSQTLDQVAIYRVDKHTGSLTEIKASPVNAGVRSNFRLAMSPDGRLLYVPGRFTKNLMVFRSDTETGELTPLEDNNFPTHGDRARYVSTSPDGRFVYVTNTNSNSVAAYKVDGERIKPVEGMPFEVADAPQAATVHPNGKFLYVPNWQGEKLSGFTINQDSGVLTPITGFRAPTGVFPFNASIHPNGKYLYVANWLSYDISGFRIDENTGQLTSMGKPVAAEGDAPVNVSLDDEGRFAYVPTYHDSMLTVFKVDEISGKLINPRRVMTRPAVRRLAVLKGEPVRYNPRWMVMVDADKTNGQTSLGSYAVEPKTGNLERAQSLSLTGLTGTLAIQQENGLIFAGQGKKVVVLRLLGNGQLQEIANAAITPKGDVQALYVDQRGHHLYVTTSSPAQYLAYGINGETGTLTEIERVTLPDDARPVRITSTPEQRLNFVLDKTKNRIFVFRFLSNDGPNMYQMTNRGSPFTMGEGLSDMLIDSTGRFGLMVQSKTAGVSVYRMPTIWGPLTQVGKKSLSVGKQPIAITMHPGGEFFYVLDAGNNSIHQLHLDAANGKLTIARDAVSVRAEPRSLSIDPSGRFAYLRYTANEGLTRYEIDQATGQLTNPDEVLEGSMPSAVVISAELR